MKHYWAFIIAAALLGICLWGLWLDHWDMTSFYIVAPTVLFIIIPLLIYQATRRSP